MRDGLIHYSSVLVSGLAGLVLVPILLAGLGEEPYGLLIAAVALASLLATLDTGLGWSLTRAVASDPGGTCGEETTQFVQTVGRLYVVIGCTGALLVAVLGLPLSAALHLSDASRQVAPFVFALVGLSFLGDRVLAFGSWVLTGRRRFDAVTLLSIAYTLVRAAGIIILVAAGRGVLSVATWHMVATGMAAVSTLVVVARLEPQFQLRPGRVDGRGLRSHLRFALTSQLTQGAIRATWEAGPLLIGTLLGSALIVPYYIGQRFPLALAELGWRAAHTLFPIASEHEGAQRPGSPADVLEVGTRWVLVLVLPLSIILELLAPALLQAWVGEIRPETLLVLRLITAAVLVDALGVGAMHILWGRGRAQAVLAVHAGVAVACIGLTLALLPRMGIVGAAWGMLIPMGPSSVAFLVKGCRAYRSSIAELLQSVTRGLWLPAALGAGATLGASHLLRSDDWPSLVASALAGGLTYTAAFYVAGARAEERILVQELLRLPQATALLAWRWLGRLLRG